MHAKSVSITLGNITLELEVDYQPFEEQEHNYPGCEESVDTTGVSYLGNDVTELLAELGVDWSELDELALHAVHAGER